MIGEVFELLFTLRIYFSVVLFHRHALHIHILYGQHCGATAIIIKEHQYVERYAGLWIRIGLTQYNIRETLVSNSEPKRCGANSNLRKNLERQFIHQL